MSHFYTTPKDYIKCPPFKPLSLKFDSEHCLLNHVPDHRKSRIYSQTIVHMHYIMFDLMGFQGEI